MRISNLNRVFVLIFTIGFFFSCHSSEGNTSQFEESEDFGASIDTIKPIIKSEAEWKKKLTKEEYHVLREHGTERAFTGDLLNVKAKGVYKCAACGLELFRSETKFESGTGWPSFYDRISKLHVKEAADDSYGMKRTEVHCGRCKGHLGHVFDDGPPPTGLRYCINSVSLDFEKRN